MNSLLSRSLLLAVLSAAAAFASADPLTYTLSGNGSGVLNGTSFTNSLITLQAVADPSTLTSSGGVSYVTASSATVSVAGIGSDTFTVTVKAYAYNPNSAAGFSFNDGVIIAMSNPQLGSWNLISPIGPVSGTAAHNAGPWSTKNGNFQVSSISTATFQAVPEPTTMVALGLGALGLLRRRKARSAA